jgi:transmembrane sensor
MEEQNVDVIARIAELIDGYLFNKLSIAELDELELWINASDINQQIFKGIINERELSIGGKIYTAANTISALNTVKKTIIFPKKGLKSTTKLWVNMGIAASLITVLGFSLYFISANNKTNTLNKAVLGAAIKTGKYIATLTLADGKKISLSDTKTGVVINSSKVTYTDGTSIKTDYNENDKLVLSEQVIQTPVGGTYQIVLADGTKVWLNAASSFRFTSSFKGLVNRKVELLAGEAYFEVSKDKIHPFVVLVNGQEVEVMGTHFNINNYQKNGMVKTTLIEGSVKVKNTASGKNNMLKPGQQSIVIGDNMQIITVDTNPIIAWKNGDFEFKDESIKDVMNKLALWYNIEVLYEGSVSTERFNGKISRNKQITAVLRMLEATKSVKFKIEGRRVTVI